MSVILFEPAPLLVCDVSALPTIEGNNVPDVVLCQKSTKIDLEIVVLCDKQFRTFYFLEYVLSLWQTSSCSALHYSHMRHLPPQVGQRNRV
jgi:hypothetical protein